MKKIKKTNSVHEQTKAFSSSVLVKLKVIKEHPPTTQRMCGDNLTRKLSVNFITTFLTAAPKVRGGFPKRHRAVAKTAN